MDFIPTRIFTAMYYFDIKIFPIRGFGADNNKRFSTIVK
jgi:hypothetical protein